MAVPAGPPRRTHDLLSISVLLGLALWFGLPRFGCGLDLGDEGNLAYGAVRVLQGQIPHHDFVSIQPPLAYYTVAAVFKLSGTSLWSLHTFGFCVSLLIPILVYLVGREFLSPGLALSAALPSICLGISFTHFVPFAVWQGAALSLGAVFCCLRATMPGPSIWGFAAGALSGAALFCRQDQGIYVLIATGLYAAATRFVPDFESRRNALARAMWYWVGGLAAAVVPLISYFLLKGALTDLVHQLIVFPLTVYPHTSSAPFPKLKDILAAGANDYIALYYVVPLAVLIGMTRLVGAVVRRRFGAEEAKLVLLVAFAGLFYCQVFARSDLPHLLVTLPPFFVLAAVEFDWLSRVIAARAKRPVFARRLAACGVAAAVAGFIWMSRLLWFHPVLPANSKFTIPRAQVRVPAAENLQSVIQAVQQLAVRDRSILCLPYQPMIYFLSERRNPTRWNYLWPGDQTAADLSALIDQARRDPPAAVLLFEEEKMQAYAASVLDYVHANYHVAADAGGVLRIYVPN